MKRFIRSKFLSLFVAFATLGAFLPAVAEDKQAKTVAEWFKEPIYALPGLQTVHDKACEIVGIKDLRDAVGNVHELIQPSDIEPAITWSPYGAHLINKFTLARVSAAVIRPWAYLGKSWLTKSTVAKAVAMYALSSYFADQQTKSRFALESGAKIVISGFGMFVAESIWNKAWGTVFGESSKKDLTWKQSIALMYVGDWLIQAIKMSASAAEKETEDDFDFGFDDQKQGCIV